VYGGVGPLAAVPFGNAAGPYYEKGAAGRFALPAVGSLLEAPSDLIGVRCFFGHKKTSSLERDEVVLALPP